MKFDLVDDVVHQAADRIVVIKQVTQAEEYLADHFPSFAVLPGVLMIETMVQAARRLLEEREDGWMVLGEVRTMKFGSMVRPGQALEVEVALDEPATDGTYACRGTGRTRPGSGGTAAGVQETAVSGRFTMRPLRIGREG